MNAERKVERKVDRNNRLEAYLATLRSPSLKELLKRSAAHWQLYAAVTGSAMAMASNVGTANRHITAGPISTLLALEQHSAASQNTTQITPMMKAVAGSSQSHVPAIANGGIVPVYGTVGVIQPGEWVSIYGTNLAGGTAVWNGDFPNSPLPRLRL